jgi:hypothetical protein
MNSVIANSASYTIKSWNIDTSSSGHIFTEQAFSFATQLSKKLGGEVYYLSDSDNTSDYYYAVVKLGDLYLDVFGTWKKEKFFQFWKDYQLEHSQRNQNLEFHLILTDGSMIDDSVIPEGIMDKIVL